MDDYNDYKSEQDRLFDEIRNLADFEKANEREHLRETKALIDKGVKVLAEYGTDTQKAREIIIQVLKNSQKLPANYSYPDEGY